MKNVCKIFGIAVLIAVIGFSFTACGDSSSGSSSGPSGPTTTSKVYKGVDESLNVYELDVKITGTPKTGDAYTLTISLKSGGSPKKSSGTVSGISGGTFTLKHSGGTSFDVTTGSDALTTISAAIPLDGGGTQAVSGTLTSVTSGGDRSLNGTWTKGSMTVTFNGASFTYKGGDGTYPGTASYSGGSGGVLVTQGTSGGGWLVAGRYTLSGSTLTFSGFDTMDYDGAWIKQ